MIDGGTAHRPQKTESCLIIFLAIKEKESFSFNRKILLLYPFQAVKVVPDL